MNRCGGLLFLCGAFACSSDGDAPPGSPPDSGGGAAVVYPDPDWATAQPGDEGLDPARLDEAAAAAESHESYCLLVVRHGVLVYERYFLGATETTLNRSWSIAKSHSSTLVGMAVANGDLAGLESPVADYIPEWAGSPRESITLRDLVSMTSGLEWSIFQDYVQMATFASDESAFAVGLDASDPPGSTWTYHNGAVQVLEPLLRSATGMTVEAYAQEHLWSRIGMQPSWEHDEAGHPTTYANVMATCRDHARFGYLYLRGGRWADGPVVPAEWVEAALTPSQTMNRGYGYLFWLNGEGPVISPFGDVQEDRLFPFAPPDMFVAKGFGGQFIDVIPSLDLVVVRLGKDPLAEIDLNNYIDQLRADDSPERHQAILTPILESVVGP